MICWIVKRSNISFVMSEYLSMALLRAHVPHLGMMDPSIIMYAMLMEAMRPQTHIPVTE